MTMIKNIFLLIILASLVSYLPANEMSNWAQRKPVNFEDLEKNFQQPDMHYAPFMFWFWDEPLNPKKMAEMSATIASQRINPGYAHPRSTAPLVTPLNSLPKEQWLSEKWFESFDGALNEAEKAGTYLGYCGAIPYAPTPRGINTFVDFCDWPVDTRPRAGGLRKHAVECAVRYGVNNITQYVLKVDEVQKDHVLNVIYER